MQQGQQTSGLFREDSGWWLGKKPSEKYEFVNWDDELPNIWENAKNGNQTTNRDLFGMVIFVQQMLSSQKKWRGETPDKFYGANDDSPVNVEVFPNFCWFHTCHSPEEWPGRG